MIAPEYIRSDEFWEDSRCYVAGEWPGDFPDLVVPDGSVLFQTSGSTGVPKWVVLSKESLKFSAGAVNAWLDVRSCSKWGLALPLNHVGGFGVVARAYLAACGMAVFDGKWDAKRFIKWVGREGISHISLVPTQLYDLVKGGFLAPSCLRALVVGGGRLGDKLGQAARAAGWPVLESYGMTEASSQIATQELRLLDMPFAESRMKILPIWNVRRTEGGLFQIRGDALFSGFLRKREGDWLFEKQSSDWFTTTDRGAVEGDFVLPEGRADSTIKIMGELVDVEAVERRFLEMAGDRVPGESFAVLAVQDPRKENVLVAVFEQAVENAAECIAEYQKLASGVERFDRYVVVDRFPRTLLGKLKRGELTGMFGSEDS